VSSIDLSDALWRKSSYSNGQANCVEAATIEQGGRLVAVRDSKARDSSKLIFGVPAWRQFITEVKAVANPRHGRPEQRKGYSAIEIADVVAMARR
jgi:hypothetical protein